MEITNIYFIGSVELKTIKIGISHNPNKRFKQLQEGNHADLELFKVLRDVPIEYEIKLHHKFRKLRLRGEWFELNNQLFQFVANVNEDNLNELIMGSEILFHFDTTHYTSPKYGETKDIIVEMLNEKDMTFDRIQKRVDKAKSTVSQHLRELTDSGRITVKKDPIDRRGKIFSLCGGKL